MALFTLPNEVIVQILTQLDYHSLLSLFSIPELKIALSKLISIVSDTGFTDSELQVIPSNSRFELQDLEHLNGSTWIVIIALKKTLKPTIVNIVTRCKKCHIFFAFRKEEVTTLARKGGLFWRVGDKNMTECSRVMQQIIGINQNIGRKLIHSITMDYIVNAEFYDMVLDPTIIHFSERLEKMLIENCSSSCQNYGKFDLPSHVDINLLNSQSLIKNLDFEKYPKVLSIKTTSKHLKPMTDLVFTKVEDFMIYIRDKEEDTINLGNPAAIFCQLGNLKFPVAKQIMISSPISWQLSDIECPNLETLSIFENSFEGPGRLTVFQNFKAPKLHTLSLRGVSSVKFEEQSLYVPKLKNISVMNASLMGDESCSGFNQKIKGASISGLSIVDTLQKLNTTCLKRMELDLSSHRISNSNFLSYLNFPKLVSLDLRYQGSDPFILPHLHKVPNFNAPKLENVSIFRAGDLNALRKLKNLKTLELFRPVVSELNNFHLYNLKKLKIDLEDTGVIFKIKNCRFPCLLELRISSKVPTLAIAHDGDILQPSVGNLTYLIAPKLKILHISICMEELSLLNFTNLREVKVEKVQHLLLGRCNWKVKKLILDEDSLEKITVPKKPLMLRSVLSTRCLQTNYRTLENFRKCICPRLAISRDVDSI